MDNFTRNCLGVLTFCAVVFTAPAVYKASSTAVTTIQTSITEFNEKREADRKEREKRSKYDDAVASARKICSQKFNVKSERKDWKECWLSRMDNTLGRYWVRTYRYDVPERFVHNSYTF